MNKFIGKRLRRSLMAGLASVAVLILLHVLAKSYVVGQVEKRVRDTMLECRAFHQYVQRDMHPAYYRLVGEGRLPEGFYAPELLSSSYIARTLQQHYNEERRNAGLPEIHYKIAAEDSRNPVNEADARERTLIGWFNEDKTRTEYREVVKEDGKTHLLYARPFLAVEQRCLKCHGDPEDAPAELRDTYGWTGGWNRKVGDIVAAEFIRSPLEGEFDTAMVFMAGAVVVLAAGLTLLLFNSRLRTIAASRTKDLQESEARLRQVAETIEDVFWVTDCSSHKTVFASQAYEKIWGRPLRDLYNDARNWADAIHPEDRRRAWETFVRLEAGHTYDEEYRIIRPDGSVRWIRDRGYPISGDDGGVDRVIGIAQDITERKLMEDRLRESEARFRELFTNMTSGVAVYSVEERGTRFVLKDMNEAGERISSTEREDVVGRSVLEVFPGIQEMGLLDVLQEVWRTGTPARHPATVYKDDRIERWYENQVYKLPSGEVVALFEDVTNRKQAEEAARSAQERLLALQRDETERVRSELDRVREQLVQQTRLATVGQVAASIAHELRNPLGAVRNAAYYLKRHVPAESPKLPEYLGIIEHEVESADRVIRDMMEMVRAKQPVTQDVELGKLISEVSGKAFPHGNIRCKVLLEQRPFTVRADPGQLRQVFDNLLTNAGQAMSGQGEIVLKAWRSGDYDIITIQDSGPGIAPECGDRVFEPLYTTKAKGTGLGLTICRQIIQRHGGTITVAQTDTAGAMFRVELPH